MSAQFENHFSKILAYLSADGSSVVLPANSLGYSGADNTLRLHDGCTRGGRYKLQMTKRCVTEEGFGVNPRLVAKTSAQLLQHRDLAGIATAETIEKVFVQFKAEWPDYGGSISVTVPFENEEPEIVKTEKGLKLVNYADQINDKLGQYGIVAAAINDNTIGGRLAIKGPKDLGFWELTLTDSTGASSTINSKQA